MRKRREEKIRLEKTEIRDLCESDERRTHHKKVRGENQGEEVKERLATGMI